MESDGCNRGAPDFRSIRIKELIGWSGRGTNQVVDSFFGLQKLIQGYIWRERRLSIHCRGCLHNYSHGVERICIGTISFHHTSIIYDVSQGLSSVFKKSLFSQVCGV
jgi:hypothetical protein